AAVLEVGTMPDPLPDLSAADLRGRRVLHQIVERHAADAAEPNLDTADPHIVVLPQPGLADRARPDDEEIVRAAGSSSARSPGCDETGVSQTMWKILPRPWPPS